MCCRVVQKCESLTSPPKDLKFWMKSWKDSSLNILMKPDRENHEGVMDSWSQHPPGW